MNENIKKELNFPYPDRSIEIDFHSKAIQKGLSKNDFDSVNLSYAKLIESLRQQNTNLKGTFDDILSKVSKDYKDFRNLYGYEYPKDFIQPFSLNNEKTNEINIYDLVGFFGTLQYSENKRFCTIYKLVKTESSNIALVFENKLLFTKNIENPIKCDVSNNGIVVCCDSLKATDMEGAFYIFNADGQCLYSKKTTANVGLCSISANGKVALFETHKSNTDDSAMIFLIDVQKGTMISKFCKPISFSKITIDTSSNSIGFIDHRNFIYISDFQGKHINKCDYENQIMTNGSVNDKLLYYLLKPNEKNHNDENYLALLKEALIDNDVTYSIGLDKINRLIGEYYVANKNIRCAIQYWEKAIEINPKIGIKKKLDAMKRKQ